MKHNHAAHQSLIFAHRGANREAAENTRCAFSKAMQYPIDGIETDVQLSRDEVCVLWHDRFLEKLGFSEKRIDDFDFAELETMDFAGYFSPESKPEKVLTLKEFVDSYRGRCRLQIEIKNRDWENRRRHEIKMQQCLDLLRPAQELDVFISSFNLQCLIFAHHHTTEVPLFYSFRDDVKVAEIEEILKAQEFLFGLCLHIETLNAEVMRLLQDHKKCVATYTCNSEAQIGKALDLKVDVLISDFPQKALQMRT